MLVAVTVRASQEASLDQQLHQRLIVQPRCLQTAALLQACCVDLPAQWYIVYNRTLPVR
jgi:hypothetical protein